MAGVIVLDASALIAMQVNTDTHHSWAIDFMHSTVGFDFAMSSVTYAEVLVQPARAEVTQNYISKIQGLNINLISVQSEDSISLAQIRAETKLLMPDAIALQTAEKLDAGIATADAKLAAAARARGVEVYSPATN